MLYRVKARYREDALADFYRRLTSEALRNQKPDGQEIIASMRRARVTSLGVIEWTETCYCPTPLRHERQTLYDHFLDRIETEAIDNNAEIDGEPFMELLARRAGG